MHTQRAQTAAMTAAPGRLDAVAFTGGVGERLIRSKDSDSMSATFDLSSYEDVRANADRIYHGSMQAAGHRWLIRVRQPRVWANPRLCLDVPRHRTC